MTVGKRTTTVVLLVVLVLGPLPGCLLFRSALHSPVASRVTDEQIQDSVHVLLERLMDDESVNFDRSGTARAWTNTYEKRSRLKDRLSNFIIALIRDSSLIDHETLLITHEGMLITRMQFREFSRKLENALREVRVSEHDLKIIVDKVDALAPSIVEDNAWMLEVHRQKIGDLIRAGEIVAADVILRDYDSKFMNKARGAGEHNYSGLTGQRKLISLRLRLTMQGCCLWAILMLRLLLPTRRHSCTRDIRHKIALRGPASCLKTLLVTTSFKPKGRTF